MLNVSAQKNTCVVDIRGWGCGVWGYTTAADETTQTDPTDRPHRQSNTGETTGGTKDGIILNGGHKHKTEIQTDPERSADRTADS